MSAKLEDLENLVNKTKEKFGKIDILINNAGVSSQYPFQEQPIEDFERLAHTNYLGYVRLIRLVINDMIKIKSVRSLIWFPVLPFATLCRVIFLFIVLLKVGLAGVFKRALLGDCATMG